MRGPVLGILAFLAGGALLTAPAPGQENKLLAFQDNDFLPLEVQESRFPVKVEELVLPEGYNKFSPRVHFPPGGGVELFFSFGGKDPRTELWRWEGGRAILVAKINGIVADEIQELPKSRGSRRLLLQGDNPTLGLDEHLFILMGPSFYHVVELSPDGPPRTVWRSEDLVKMSPESQPSVSIDPEGKRWAAALGSLRPGKGVVSATVHVGELPETEPSLEFQWIPSETPEIGERPYCFKSEYVRFVGKNRLVLVAGGAPLLLELVGNELRPILLEVPALPVLERAFYHEPSRLLLLESQIGQRDLYGFVLPPEDSILEGNRLPPTFRLERKAPWRGTIVAETPEGFVFEDDESQFEKKATLVFSRVQDGGTLEVTKKLVLHRRWKGFSLVDLSPDGRTLLGRISKEGCESKALVRMDLSSIFSR